MIQTVTTWLNRAWWMLPLLAGLTIAATTAGVIHLMDPTWRAASPWSAAAPRPAGGPPPKVILRLHGSNTIGARLAPALAEAFLRDRLSASEVTIEQSAHRGEWRVVGRREGERVAIAIHGHGSSTAFIDLRAGLADVGLASRRIRPGEAEVLHRLGDMKHPDCEHILGVDGVAVIVHPSRGSGALTLTPREVAAVFMGRIDDWERLSGRTGPIRIYARNHRSGTFQLFKRLVLRGRRLAPAARRYESNARLSAAVAGDPRGIGFVPLPQVQGNRAVAIRAPGGPPVVPEPDTITTEDYPLSRRLYLYSAKRPKNALVTRFVRFSLSEAGQALVERFGFIPLRVREIGRSWGGKWPGHLRSAAGAGRTASRRELRHARRLSVSFRFRGESLRLDNRGLRDLSRVARYLARRGGAALLVGHDGPGPAYGARGYGARRHGARRHGARGQGGRRLRVPAHGTTAHRRALARARAVAVALEEHGVTVGGVWSLGSRQPLAADDTATNRWRNRRVEIWRLPGGRGSAPAARSGRPGRSARPARPVRSARPARPARPLARGQERRRPRPRLRHRPRARFRPRSISPR
jgi:phosphate transport system substrate-binding protein